MQSNNINLYKIIKQAYLYIKKAQFCKQQKVIDANKFAGAYCQPHLVRITIRDLVNKIISRPQLHPNRLSYRTLYSNQLMAEIHQKNYEANLIKKVSADENNEIIYTNYALGLFDAAMILGFRPVRPLYKDIHDHAYQTALRDLKVSISIHNSPKNSKIINFPIKYRRK